MTRSYKSRLGHYCGQLLLVPRFFVGALMIVIMLLVNVEVVLRFFLNFPLDWVSEVVLSLFPWLSMLGAAVAFNTFGANIALHIFDGHLSEKAKSRIGVFVNTATLFFGVFLILFGFSYMLLTSGEVTNTLEISRSWEILAFPISGVLIVAYSMGSIWTLLHPSPNSGTDVLPQQF